MTGISGGADSTGRAQPFVLTHIVQQHFDELAMGGLIRHHAVNSPLKLWAIDRADRRLRAHLDGLEVAGEAARRVCEEALTAPTSDTLFAATVWALKCARENFDHLLAIAETAPDTRSGLLAALGWTDPMQLRGVVAPLLAAEDPFRRLVGVAACALHRVDAALVSRRLQRDPDPLVRARALRAAGELGLLDIMPTCIEELRNDDPECQFWAAWSAVLLGDRDRALDRITRFALTPGPRRARAFKLAIQTINNPAAHAMLEQLAPQPEHQRWLIVGSGITGDPTYVPWLIRQMNAIPSARAAGEAFTLITGADLDKEQLWMNRSEEAEVRPNDNPDDSSVDMDPDEGLHWPDREKIEKWWGANLARFKNGTRYFMGVPLTREHCIDVLKNGHQRQRILAAHYLCLLDSGTPLFNTSAPAWRQQRLLAQMT